MKNSRKFPSAERSSLLNFSSHPTSFEISSCYILPVKFGFLKSLLLWIWHFPHSTFHCILPLQRAEFQLPVYTDHKFIEGWNFKKSTFRWRIGFFFHKKKWKKTEETRPNILCVTHQMNRKKRDYSVDWTVPYEMMNYKWYSNVGWLFCTPAPPKFTKKLAVDSFFNFGSWSKQK